MKVKLLDKGEKIPMCGRPLGLAWDQSKNDTIIVMDSSLGVLELNVKTKKLKRVIFNNEEVGREVRSFSKPYLIKLISYF